MKIAVNTRFLIPGSLEGYGYYIHEIFRRITQDHPEHEFIFLYDKAVSASFPWTANIRSAVLGPRARHPLLWKWWYDIRLPSLLAKTKVDLLVSPDGFCSMRAPCPQVMVLHDLAYIHHPEFIPRSHLYYYRYAIPRCISKAQRIVTVSQFSEKDILAHFPGVAGKTRVIHNGVRDGFAPLSYERRQEVKSRISGGAEYFLYAGAIHPRKNIVNLLKAFSLFKKRQRSAMKLVIAGRLAWMSGEFTQKLTSYKYRDEVVITGYLDDAELVTVMASAYALVYPSFLEGFGMPVAEAMRAGVPVITSRHSAMEEIAAGAALLADPVDPASIAAQMMRLYKDESLRSELVEKGLGNSKRYNWDDAAAAFYDVMMEAAGLKP